jgi:hypothetical protein
VNAGRSPDAKLAARRRNRALLRLVLRGAAGDHEAPQAVVVGLEGSVVATTSRISSEKASGSSWWGKWPAPSKICRRLPGQLPCARIPWRAGMTGSLSPHTSRVGTS